MCKVTFHEDAAKNSGDNIEEFEAMGARESLVEGTQEKTSWIVIRNDGTHAAEGHLQNEESDLANDRFQLVYRRDAGAATDEDEDEDEAEDNEADDDEDETEREMAEKNDDDAGSAVRVPVAKGQVTGKGKKGKKGKGQAGKGKGHKGMGQAGSSSEVTTRSTRSNSNNKKK